MQLSREKRQAIVDDFIQRNGGYSAQGFLAEVRRSNGSHPAWAWFDWDDPRAAEEHRLWQARTFVRDLTISFSVETVTSSAHGFTVSAPRVLSPAESRPSGGGYRRFDPESAEDVAELATQAATAFASWRKRYEAALYASGVKQSVLDAIAKRLSG